MRIVDEMQTLEEIADRGAKPPSAVGSQEWATELMLGLADRRYAADRPPPVMEPILSIMGVSVGTPGNLVAITGQTGSGKSRWCSAAIASSLAPGACDSLGWQVSNSDSRGIIYLDMEQSPQDFYTVLADAGHRSGRVETPEWLHAYHLTGFGPEEALRTLEAALMYCKELYGGTRLAMVDGFADLVQSPNDEGECFALVRRLQVLAIKHSCVIAGVIHVNPSSDAKTRGHLGSQLDRKCESVITLKRDGEAIVGYTKKARHRPIPESSGPRFAWEETSGMFASVSSKADVKASALGELARGAFCGAGGGISYQDLVAKVMQLLAVKERTAKARISEMRRSGIVNVQEGAGHYYLADGTSA